ncbi:MAG: S6e family ribosomal protein [Candidatus Nanoarchaeia archaeon]
MSFKLNISESSGKTYKLELENESLNGKSLGDKISGNDLNTDLSGYEFIIAGASDKSGFTAMTNVPGIGLKKVLLTYGKAMKKRPKHEGKRKRSTNRPKGLRLRKTVRGKIISEAITQINLKVTKEGSKKLNEIFPDQNNKPLEKVSKEEIKEGVKTEEKPTGEKPIEATAPTQ